MPIDLSNPKPGLYPGLDFEEYKALPFLNNSYLRLVDDSPQEFKYAVDNPDAGEGDSGAKSLGTGTHMLLFEPAKFNALRVAPPINPTTGKAFGVDSQKFQQFAAANPGKIVVSDADLAAMTAMVRSIRANPEMAKLLNQAVAFEESMLWRDPVTGLMCKGRLDGRCPRAILDIKTTRSIRGFRKSMVEFFYHTQQFLYLEGLQTLGHPIEAMYFCLVRSEPPYATKVVTIGPDTMLAAATLVNEWRAKIKRCIERGSWPGPQGDPTEPDYMPCEELEAPAWYLQQFMDSENSVMAA